MQKSDENTGNTVDVPDIVSENPKLIDEILAKQNVPISGHWLRYSIC